MHTRFGMKRWRSGFVQKYLSSAGILLTADQNGIAKGAKNKKGRRFSDFSMVRCMFPAPASVEPGADVRTAEDNVHQWILASGLNIAKAERSNALRATTAVSLGMKHQLETAAPGAPDIEKPPGSGETWVAFLRRHTHLKVPQLAAALPHVTTEYLVLVSRHPAVVPSERQKRARRVHGEKVRDPKARLASMPSR
jgi:hypothetical protein